MPLCPHSWIGINSIGKSFRHDQASDTQGVLTVSGLSCHSYLEHEVHILRLVHVPAATMSLRLLSHHAQLLGGTETLDGCNNT